MSRIGFFVLLTLFLPSLCFSAQPLDVVINEIAWMGMEKRATDEWIELFNNSNQTIDLKGWKLISIDGTPTITLAGNIQPQGFFLLERTDDQSIQNIPADLIYKGALNNKGEGLQLLDQKGKIIDEVNCQQGWFAGNNQTKQTMERNNSKEQGSLSTNWHTSKNPGGTPKVENGPPSQQKPSQKQKENILVIDQEGLLASPSLISNLQQKPKGFVFILATGLIISLLSTFILLLVKKNLKPYH
jgi:hypothetical protein